jgi:abequosyltransferase
MSGPLLSFCIPTHHGRAAYLKEAIDSMLEQIVGQHEGDVQICVSDNGSDDGTAELLAGY